MGIPSIVTSDQGPQFISPWWTTLCARLGIRQAYSQAYHHQANGRAEGAIRILKDVLRALLVDQNISWVQALPRALRIIHDSPDPHTGLSPYEIMFGRPRNTAHLPLEAKHTCYDAEELCQNMHELDQKIAKLLNERHEKEAQSRNRRRPLNSTLYKRNDYVWVKRPNEVGGVKLDTRWTGPYRVVTWTGEHSYQVQLWDSVLDAHVIQPEAMHLGGVGRTVHENASSASPTQRRRGECGGRAMTTQ